MKKYSNIVLNVPHSSIDSYQEGWLGSVNMFPLVKRWTDWHTDILFGSSIEGVSMVRYDKSRFYCDVERLENDPMKGIGQGICYTRFDDFQREVSKELYDKVMHDYYSHRRVLSSHITSNDTLLIDCHSFPSDLSDVDVCIGFNDDNSKPDNDVLDFVCSLFGECGYSVSINKPYSNSITPPSDFAYKSFMIEVNKRVYLDEDTLLLKPTNAVSFKHLLDKMYLSLLGR